MKLFGKRKLTDYEQRIIENVESSGCHITCVSDDPPFAYSTGLSRTGDRPEVIIFGLDLQVAAAMINLVRDKYEEGVELADGEPVDWLLNGFECIPFTISPKNVTREHFNSAIWYRAEQLGAGPPKAMQIVWPSEKTGRFPWDPECEADVVAAQPNLYEATAIQ